MLSVVVPVYNEESFIGPCIEAILAQRDPVDEIIVVDNNSTDGTRRALAAYDGLITVLASARQGVQHARNTGMNAASGEVIGRIDADTRLPPDWSFRLRAGFADPAVQALTGPARYYDVAWAPLTNLGDAVIRGIWSARMDWILGANMAIRAAAWRRVRGDLCSVTDVHEDLDLGIHLHDAGLRVRYDRGLWAGMSSRRIADRFGAYRDYLVMIEAGYRRHPALAGVASYPRAWVTARVLMGLWPPLHLLHAVHRARAGGTSTVQALRASHGRKNPMLPLKS